MKLPELKERLKNKYIVRVVAGVLTIALVGTGIGATAVFADKNNSTEVTSEASSEAKSTDDIADDLLNGISLKDNDADKDESVYLISDANGNVDKTIVVDHLKNKDKKDSIEDTSNLKDITNVNGKETFDQNGDKITWQAGGNDIYYQGTSSDEPPVSQKVTYYLDDKEISPEDLAGKSGKVKIRFDYTNNTTFTETVNGEQQTVSVPFAAVTALVLGDGFKNVEVTNGKVEANDTTNVVLGYALPGLKDSLGIKDEDLDDDVTIPEYVEVTADVEDFSLSTAMTFVVNASDFVSSDGIDTSGLDDMIGDLQDATKQLQDGSSTLADGADTLSDGVGTLQSSLGTFADGMGSLQDGLKSYTAGASKINDGINTLGNSTGSLASGATQLNNGAKSLAAGTGTLSKGAATLDDGAATLKSGADKVNSGASNLKDGASKVNAGASSLMDGAVKANEGASSLKDGAAKVNEGASSLKDGAAKVNEGASSLKDGASQVDAGASSLKDGVDKVNAGAANLKDGADKVNTGASNVAAGASDLSAGVNELAATVSGMPETMKKEINDELAKKTAALMPILNQFTITEVTVDNLDAVVNLMKTNKTGIVVAMGKDESLYDTAMEGLYKAQGSVELYTNVSTQLAGKAEDITKLTKGASDLKDGAASLAQGTKDLASGAATLSDGTASLADGSKTLKDGTASLAKGASDLKSGTASLKSGAATLNTGAGTLAAGTQSLADKIPSLTSGIKQLVDGSNTLVSNNSALLSGASQLAEGTTKLVGGVDTLAAGSKDLAEGAHTLADGIVEFNEEGINKILDSYNGDMKPLVNKLQAVIDAGEDYQTYSSLADGQTGSVKFIYKLASIESDDK